MKATWETLNTLTNANNDSSYFTCCFLIEVLRIVQSTHFARFEAGQYAVHVIIDAAVHKVSPKMLSVMLTVVSEQEAKGFCIPPDLIQDEDAQRKEYEDQKTTPYLNLNIALMLGTAKNRPKTIRPFERKEKELLE